VAKLLRELDAIHFFDDPEIAKQPSRYPPDASHNVIAATLGDKRQRIALWREPAPTTQPADRFEEIWSQARKLIADRVPKEGQAIEKIDERIFDVGRAPRK